ncbi:hormone-sensitive lipase-like [Mizuhopecten yessoensis]|uniref:Hormone-sensitive lipase n=1 Tax=Mizuhopecten yessoensis TaxID=6573 RepID=A0A210QYM9_MIZYE|nr:hormone-sensitive lipase-like [Mizuhopecten yessoensis]OWF53834.1 Hormone-sensitive lipase [Mizuhopecten yessoensis]
MFTALFKDLRSFAVSNIAYFHNGKSSTQAKFHAAFCLLQEHIDRGIQPTVELIAPRLAEYDLSPDVQANGFRSIIKIIHKCCLHILQLVRHIHVNRESMFFRSAHYSSELEAYVETLGQLRACLEHAYKLMDFCKNGSLFADEEMIDDAIAEELTQQVEKLSQECFYGRTMGFQFCSSMQKPLNTVGVTMASFSENYLDNRSQLMQLAGTVLSSGKYLLNPELRARQICAVTRMADVRFCKAFWSITESGIMQQLPTFVCPSVQVNEVLVLQPETFEIEAADSKETVTITPPCAHTGHGPVNTRLFSSEYRVGQPRKSTKPLPKKTTPLPLSPCLLIHCHGGGFVAQSSKSHEVYLRQWAKDLNVPILSIDYSLSPESPFPRALEECFYAYAWAVKNCRSLGSTGEVICLAGDSAGGNLMISTAMRAASFGIRVPDGIVAAYTPVLVHYTPSPSRMLSLMDPLLPVGILVRCMAAYAGIPNDFLDQRRSSREIEEEFVVIETMDCEEDSPSSDSYIQDDSSSVDILNRVTSLESLDSDLGFPVSSNNQTVNLSDSDSAVIVVGGAGGDQKQSDRVAVDRNVLGQSDAGVSEITSPDEFKSVCLDTSGGSSLATSTLGDLPLDEKGDDPSKQLSQLELANSQPPSQRSCQSLHLSLPSSPTKRRNKSDFPMSPSMPTIGVSDRLGQKKGFSPVYEARHHIESPVRIFRSLPIVKNPYMSPMVAPDEMLASLPPLYLVGCHLDPLLDDSVMFAKKLRSLGRTVDLHMVDDLPHGFLNFSLVSAEAKLGSDVLVDKIRNVFHSSLKDDQNETES